MNKLDDIVTSEVSGRVLDPVSAQDEQTRALVAYADKVRSDARVEQVMVPLRDGISVARRK